MDWSSILGGFIGAAIPSSVALIAMRLDRKQRLQDRRWVDADVVADVQQFLTEIEPMYRISHVEREGDAEAKRWEGLEARRVQVQRELLKLTTGHEDPTVRELAESLALLIVNATAYSKMAVGDEMQGRDNPKWVEIARKAYQGAHEDAVALGWAVQEAGTGRPFDGARRAVRRQLRRLPWRRRPPQLGG
jgi:hypothetical protein